LLMNLNAMHRLSRAAVQSDCIRDSDNWRDRQEASYSCQNINPCLNVHINSPDTSNFWGRAVAQWLRH
jgi:hypothetical protein